MKMMKIGETSGRSALGRGRWSWWEDRRGGNRLNLHEYMYTVNDSSNFDNLCYCYYCCAKVSPRRSNHGHGLQSFRRRECGWDNVNCRCRKDCTGKFEPLTLIE